MTTYVDLCQHGYKEKIRKEIKETSSRKSIEKGERNVSIMVLEKLAKALNISIKEFFNEN